MPRVSNTTSDQEPDLRIYVTRDYEDFVILGNNRYIVDGHARNLAGEGNVTATEPIIVNERMEVIDGQHRLQACRDNGWPVYYIKREGLTIAVARKMNILQRPWTSDDFAQSYANDNNRQYQKYLVIKEDYGYNHSITLAYIVGENRRGMMNEFRNGEFTVDDEAGARARLDKLAEAGDVLGGVPNQYFALAYLQVMRVRGFDQARMIRKLNLCGDAYMRKFGSAQDYMRAMEEVYNYMMSDTNRLRLY